MLEPSEIKRWERMTAAMLRHAGEDDPEAFAQIVAVLDNAVRQLPAVCDQLREPAAAGSTIGKSSYSWAEIGTALGTTRQAAHKRFGRKHV